MGGDITKIKVCTVEPTEPFIYEVNGRITLEGFQEVQRELLDDFWWPEGADWIELDCFYDHGETDDEGRYTVAPHWSMVLSGHGREGEGG